LARTERAAGNAAGHAQARMAMEAAFARLSSADQDWCHASLEAVRTDQDDGGGLSR